MTDTESLEKRITVLENKVANLEGKKSKRDSIKEKKSEYKGLAGAIFELIAEKFFDTPKELNAIHAKLKANTVFYPVTSYPDSLIRLVKKRELRRIKENNKWKYVKYG